MKTPDRNKKNALNTNTKVFSTKKQFYEKCKQGIIDKKIHFKKFYTHR